MQELSLQLIRASVGLTMVAFGLHQIWQPKQWVHYIPHWLEKLDPLQTTTTLRIHGAGNLVLGVLFLSGLWTIIASWLTIAWWVSILPFALYHDWRIALRDLVVIVSVIAFLAHKM